MNHSKTPVETPAPVQGETKLNTVVGKADKPGAVFVSLALDMSWKLAIAVLVPIIGGFELDKVLKTTPLLSIVGFLVAMTGMGLVMWRMVQEANELSVPSNKEKHS
jgi:F0F1-type ATP synthase assembly protein I